MAAAGATTLVFLLLRLHVSVPFVRLTAASPLVRKFRLGPLRAGNCVALGLVVARVLVPLRRRVRVKVLEMLGRNSLQVFAAHIPVCVRTDRLIGPPRASVPTALAQGTFVALMLTVMPFVAWRSGCTQWSGGPGSDRPRASAAASSYEASQRAER